MPRRTKCNLMEVYGHPNYKNKENSGKNVTLKLGAETYLEITRDTTDKNSS